MRRGVPVRAGAGKCGFRHGACPQAPITGKAGSLVRIERQHDATRLNAIINHPAVFDTAVGLAAAWPVDFAQVFEAHPGLLAFAGDYGIALFAPVPEVPKAYDSHFAVVPEGRGEWCREAAREVLYRMFWEHEADLLLFRCPQGNLAASAGAKMLGGRFYLETEPRFPSLSGPVPFNVYYLTRKRWLEVTGRSN